MLAASPDKLIELGQVSRSLAQAIHQGPDDAAKRAIDHELNVLQRSNITIVTCRDSGYPARLKAIPDPPPFLYVSGKLDVADDRAVAIVGSRKATAAGLAFTEQLSRDLAAMGFTIVSGLARGIDAAAHRGALAGKGRTIAVLGCGIDRTYPPEHQALRREIEASGAVITELALGSFPHAYHFPRRNRIISGMCLGVVVTESTLQSGSLITAKLAADQGREVFAVPGFVKAETSRGPNSLIKQGAKLVENVQDVIEELLPQLDATFQEGLAARSSASIEKPTQLEKNEARIYDLLTHEAIHIDDLIERTGLSAAEVSSRLLSMELKGLVRQLPGHSYLRSEHRI